MNKVRGQVIAWISTSLGSQGVCGKAKEAARCGDRKGHIFCDQ
jgi:hypothetical protein